MRKPLSSRNPSSPYPSSPSQNPNPLSNPNPNPHPQIPSSASQLPPPPPIQAAFDASYKNRDSNQDPPLISPPSPPPSSAAGNQAFNRALPDFNFYFENFPRWCVSQDLRAAFSRCGMVTHLFISRNLNRRGLRFGFVSFKRDNRAQFLYESLGNVRIEGYKISVNPTRFERKPTNVNLNSGNGRRSPLRFSSKQRDERTFAAVVSNGKTVESPDRSSLPCFFSQGCNEEWLSRSMVGYVTEIKELPEVLDYLKQESKWIQIARTMGGNSILITFHSLRSMEEFVREKSHELSAWFELLKQWDSSLKATDRLVWLRVEGVPIHAWCRRFFEYLSAFMGRFIRIDEDTQNCVRLDKAHMLIRTSGRERIDRKLKVLVDEELFEIHIVEEQDLDGWDSILKQRKGKAIIVEDEAWLNSANDDTQNQQTRRPETEFAPCSSQTLQVPSELNLDLSHKMVVEPRVNGISGPVSLTPNQGIEQDVLRKAQSDVCVSPNLGLMIDFTG